MVGVLVIGRCADSKYADCCGMGYFCNLVVYLLAVCMADQYTAVCRNSLDRVGRVISRYIPRNRGGRPKIFGDKALAQIPVWIADGDDIEVIAERLGTTVASLYSTCSRLNISLRGARKPMDKRPVTEPLELRLKQALLARLEDKASDLSMSVEHLVIVLLEQIAKDDLFNAVLDFEPSSST